MEQTSIAPLPSSSSFMHRGETMAQRQSVLAALHEVSSIKPYAALPLLRGFTTWRRGNMRMSTLTASRGVLRLCFGINKDMVRVIANAAAVFVTSMATEGGLLPGGGEGHLGPCHTMVLILSPFFLCLV